MALSHENEKEQAYTTIENMIDKFENNTISMVQHLCVELRAITQKSDVETNNSNDIKILKNQMISKYERLLQVQNILDDGFQ